MKGEYDAIRECGGQVVAVSASGLESHERFCQTMEGCPFPLVSDEGLDAARVYGVVSEDGRHSNRALFVIDVGGRLLHCIPWHQQGNIGQIAEVFKALGAL